MWLKGSSARLETNALRQAEPRRMLHSVDKAGDVKTQGEMSNWSGKKHSVPEENLGRPLPVQITADPSVLPPACV